ncbi:glycoside hydrolase family 78 protein [Athelia psychrophila]|uniref:Glycoside hydrolase family 78 protein n=1 Tax=Athelia psychrophila TaxID=1759441 RepID=A0A166VUH6_9AGAM|nr:glycoside hydrolase family 78 protein [Fibularhizoctonia sp. CBS 109695]
MAVLLLSASRGLAIAPSGPWDAFNYSPANRTVVAVNIHSTNGTVDGASGLVNNTAGSATLSGSGSYVVLDFGKEVGGRISLDVVNSTSSSAFSLSFTESPLFISPTESDDSSGMSSTFTADGVLSVPAPLVAGTYTQPAALLRGGFRYLTIVSNSDDNLTISNVALNITFASHWTTPLTDYTGYFSAQDTSGFHDVDFLNKLWYGGAYTVQTNTIDASQGRTWPLSAAQGWGNNATLGPVTGPVLVDGAKRDRTVWAGDMGISSNTQLVSTNDLLPLKNSLLVMFSTQNPSDGSLASAGPPLLATGSYTYICWTLIGAHNYHLFSGDLDFVQTVWANYTYAVAFLESQVDSTGLADVSPSFASDWGRDGGAGHNSAANALLYKTLVGSADLASKLGNTTLAAAYAANASSLKTAFNTVLWDATAGMYRDNDATSMHPEDGNSLAVLYNLTQSAEQNRNISEGLTAFWTDIGPVTPELADTIIPFVGGFELQAHFIAGNGSRALDLMRKEWGYMLYTNTSVQSTMLEGYTTNGSLYYRGAGYGFDQAYTSHSHGWSTGPTFALSFYLLGLQLQSAQGATWSVAPVLSGLNAAEGGYETGLGWFGVSWIVSNTTSTVTLQVSTPNGTNGTVALPGTGALTVDGTAVPASATSGLVEVGGGNHTVARSLVAGVVYYHLRYN